MKGPPSSRIAVAFSGGRTSAYMAKRLKERFGKTHDLIFTFANTGREHEKTLIFADRCDREFGLNLVWLEAVVHPHGTASTHKIVSFETAARSGEPFEAVIQKYGIPNKGYPHCTRELKNNPQRSYVEQTWERGSYVYAIGYRSDEMDRVPENWTERGLWFPLADWGVTKPFILTFWGQQTFDLDLPEHHGNCDKCWKKSDRKLLTLAKEQPEGFDWWDRMERTYPNAGAGDGNRVFFRRHRSTQDILRESTQPFVPFVPQPYQTDLLGHLDAMDEEDSCGAESCEIE